MHGTLDKRIDGPDWIFPVDAKLAAYFWRVVLNPKDMNALGKPQPTRGDKATTRDPGRTKELGRGLNVENPFFDAELFRKLGVSVAADGIPPWDRPHFDAYWFATYTLQYSGEIPEGIITAVSRAPVPNRFPWLADGKIKPTFCGESLTATWQGAIAGTDVSPRVTAKIGANKSHQWLVEVACPGPVDRPHRASIDRKNKNIYWSRWAHARRCFGDDRWHGKVSCEPDETYIQAAANGLEDALCQQIDVPPNHVGEDWWLVELIDQARTPVLGFFVLWLSAGLLAGLTRDPQRKNIHNYRGGLAPFHDVARPDENEERRLARLYQSGDVVAGNMLMAGHLWIVKAVARKFQGEAEKDDLEQEGTFGLYKALRDFDPESAHRFSTFAWRGVTWAMRDYLEKLRRLQRHESTDEIAQKNERALGMYARKSVEPDKVRLHDD
jgi:hypothetical protein